MSVASILMEMAKNIDHRGYVGGYWEEIGRAQFNFMKDMGLKPEHKLLDVGCGSFRGGRLFVEYLNPGNYYGIEKHQTLVDLGLKNEIKDRRGMQVVVDDNFELNFGEVTFDFMLAKSVFTHLTPSKIAQCLNNLWDYTKPDTVFYATIFNGDSKDNPEECSDRKRFKYTIEEIQELADHKWDVGLCEDRKIFQKYEPRSLQTMLKITPR